MNSNSSIGNSKQADGKKQQQKAKKKTNATGSTIEKDSIKLPSKSTISSQLTEIDELFSSAKKRKAVAPIDNPEIPKKQTKKTKNGQTPRKSSQPDVEDDSDDPDVDPYYEFIDDDDVPAQDDNATYGMINNAYNPSKIINPEAPLERIQDGVPVYKAHLLKVGEGGGTPLCPFDCNCCF